MWKSTLTATSLGMTGDLVAQGLGRYNRVKTMKADGQDTSDVPLLDVKRFFKMATFGFFYYGPLQGVWYPALDRVFPMDRTLGMAKNLFPFGMKVTLNQLLLGPMVVPVVFAWTLILEKQMHRIPEKIKNDTWPTLMKGWKFWVPAACINFSIVPLQYQILYMSSCGIFWNAILSAASAS